VTTWPKLVAVAVAALTIGVGVALVVPKITGLGQPAAPRPTPSQTVQTFTTAAASANLLRTTLGPTASQYRKVVAQDIRSGGQTLTVEVTRKDGRKTDYRYRLRNTITTWIPGDPTRKWVRTGSTVLEPIDDAARRYQEKHPDTMAGPSTSGPEYARNGDFDVPKASDDWINPSQKFLDNLPRDPAKLLEAARAWNTKHDLPNDAQDVLEALAQPLTQTRVEDPELRAALFTAIGQIEGVQLSEDATIGDQHGTALTGVSSRNPALYTEVLFDPNDYRLIGWRFVNDREGTVKTAETTFTSSIASSAP
jgi:hypothetical protein